MKTKQLKGTDYLWLYGPPASGKTTLGRLLAARLGTTFLDLDEEIEKAAGRTIPAIFAEDGEPFFRDLESETLRKIAARRDSDTPCGAVVSLGGGTLLRPENRALCEGAGTVLCLDAPSNEELARRIGAAPGSRPLGDKARERAPHYASFPNRVAAFLEAGPSLVVAGRGLAAPILRGRAVVADATVHSLWSERLGIKPILAIPSGEEHKTPATVASIWHAFAERGLGRRDTAVALGGGVTGDLTGFAAATWMRGIDWINVPTTLLSMVDASTGGKTGCDLPEGKNLAGAFHFPKLVVLDTDFLETLPDDVLAAGRAEMIKHEVIGGRRAANGPAHRIPTAAEIVENLEVKIRIVREDPLETLGKRILLNCGHTVGHAVEKASGYRIPHGAAVAIGCMEEARIAVRRGLAPAGWPDELAACFAAAGLPTEIPPDIPRESLPPLMAGDKKREGGSVVFALPCGWGDARGVKIDLRNGEMP